MAFVGSVGEGGPAVAVEVAVDRIDGGSDSGQPEEVGHDDGAALEGGLAEGRALTSRDGGVGARGEEEVHDEGVAVLGSVGEGGFAIAADGVDGGLASGEPEEVGHDVRVAIHGGLHQRRGMVLIQERGVGPRRHQRLHHRQSGP